MPKYSAARIEEIRGHLADLSRRRIPVAQFARELGVASWTVRTWQRRFKPSATSGRAPRRRDRVDLVEVQSLPSPQAIEIVAGPVTVRVPPGCDPDDLERVLRAVRSC